MSAKHTPGPWNQGLNFIGDEGDPGAYDVYVEEVEMNDGSKRAPAQIASTTPTDWRKHWGPPYQQCLANARLIAAAPDLLKAIDELLAEVAGFHNGRTEGFRMAAEAYHEATGTKAVVDDQEEE